MGYNSITLAILFTELCKPWHQPYHYWIHPYCTDVVKSKTGKINQAAAQHKPLSAVDSRASASATAAAAAASMTSLLSHSVTSGVTLRSVSLPTPCNWEDARLDRRLDLREPCLPYRGCWPSDTSGITMNRPSTGSRRGTIFSSFFCKLRWARLYTNHNNHTQVSKTCNQSRQSHAGEHNLQPITLW